MDRHNTIQHPIPSTSTSMDPVEDLTGEVDEPPDDQSRPSQMHGVFGKADPRIFDRRESLLTRQLHSETEQTDEEEDMSQRAAPPRALSTQSTWSNPSVASTAELTSDDGHSVASPAISPPLPPTHIRNMVPITEKPLAREPQIVGQEEKVSETGSEQSVEAGLGRKRCISFACGNKKKEAPTSEPVTSPKQPEPEVPASPPKRKTTLKFVCPTRAGPQSKSEDKSSNAQRRAVSPPPPARRSPKIETTKVHRGSDSTVTHASPKNTRKSPVNPSSTPTPATAYTETSTQRKMSDDSDRSTAATRFHEFASSEDEPEEWTQESTCHRSRLTVNDTLQKENVIRKACEEVEEEAVEEEDEEAELDDDDEDEDDEDDGDEDQDLEPEEESDDGFRTDDEEGFAESDSEGEESDEDWWRPGGLSTAATSIDHLDRLGLAKQEDAVPSSSLGSASSGHHSPRSVPKKAHRKHHAKSAVPIQNRPQAVDLPDSTDFVCGTLDEDRPLEQAYLNHLKQKEAAKHKARPQDIDPTFPTSDPEDEEDDEDLVDSESEQENLMHGDLEELDGDYTARRRASPRPRARSNVHRSPPPPARHRSPAPGQLKRQSTARSPPPPVRRGTARSPPPRKLFGGHSPKRARSPAPVKMMTSPPNTRRASPATGNAFETTADMLASRPQLTHTASLPRGGFMLGKLSALHIGQVEDDDAMGDNSNGDIPKRGAIDIFKGLEKKRQRRKEKLYQKACAKAAAKGEKAYKVKPGKGAERMREVGLELQRYHGKGILSM